jgi:acetyl esterase/lipase
MSGRELVDPELLWLVDLIGEIRLDADSLPELRAQFEEMTASVPPPEVPGLTITDRRIPGPDGAPEVRVVVYEPKRSGSAPTPALLWIHGGGYVIGSPTAANRMVHFFVAELGWPVVSVDYRLAPETPFPGPLEDCHAALSWMTTHADELGVDPSRFGVVGESAGGGLAASLALLARDRGDVSLAHQLLVYPMLDDRTVDDPAPSPFQGELIWTRAANRFAWTAYLGAEPGRGDVSQYAAAARAEDLSGLPPAFVSVGSIDLFCDEDIEYARRMARAGVPTELHVYPGAPHSFVGAIGMARAADDHLRDAVAALRAALAPAGAAPA